MPRTKKIEINEDQVEIIGIYERLIPEEKETHLIFDFVDKKWVMESFIPNHFKKAIKQGWTPVLEYKYKNSICGMRLTAPEWAVTIRKSEKGTRAKKKNDIDNSKE